MFNLLFYFYPRSPCGERLGVAGGTVERSCISIHALLAESDTEICCDIARKLVFLSTLSLRRATDVAVRRAVLTSVFLSTLSLRRATMTPLILVQHWKISIHALLAESDQSLTDDATIAELFLSTLSLRRATFRLRRILHEVKFLSTLSLRRATGAASIALKFPWNFYPRSPCGERHPYPGMSGQSSPISIHALLAESDSRTGRG